MSHRPAVQARKANSLLVGSGAVDRNTRSNANGTDYHKTEGTIPKSQKSLLGGSWLMQQDAAQTYDDDDHSSVGISVTSSGGEVNASFALDDDDLPFSSPDNSPSRGKIQRKKRIAGGSFPTVLVENTQDVVSLSSCSLIGSGCLDNHTQASGSATQSALDYSTDGSTSWIKEERQHSLAKESLLTLSRASGYETDSVVSEESSTLLDSSDFYFKSPPPTSTTLQQPFAKKNLINRTPPTPQQQQESLYPVNYDDDDDGDDDKSAQNILHDSTSQGTEIYEDDEDSSVCVDNKTVDWTLYHQERGRHIAQRLLNQAGRCPQRLKNNHRAADDNDDNEDNGDSSPTTMARFRSLLFRRGKHNLEKDYNVVDATVAQQQQHPLSPSSASLADSERSAMSPAHLFFDDALAVTTSPKSPTNEPNTRSPSYGRDWSGLLSRPSADDILAELKLGEAGYEALLELRRCFDDAKATMHEGQEPFFCLSGGHSIPNYSQWVADAVAEFRRNGLKVSDEVYKEQILPHADAQ